ncbi:unnamed protein product [Closterium sp. Yama58-4]|nr:unnamed protein product [Closterium sp. Yama58-4]
MFLYLSYKLLTWPLRLLPETEMALLMRLFACCILILLSVSNVSGWKNSGSFDSVAETAQQGYQQQHRRVLNNRIATTSTPLNTPLSTIPATSTASSTPTSAEAVYQLALELIAVLLNDPTLSSLISRAGVRFGNVDLPQIGNTLASGGGAGVVVVGGGSGSSGENGGARATPLILSGSTPLTMAGKGFFNTLVAWRALILCALLITLASSCANASNTTLTSPRTVSPAATASLRSNSPLTPTTPTSLPRTVSSTFPQLSPSLPPASPPPPAAYIQSQIVNTLVQAATFPIEPVLCNNDAAAEFVARNRRGYGSYGE